MPDKHEFPEHVTEYVIRVSRLSREAGTIAIFKRGPLGIKPISTANRPGQRAWTEAEIADLLAHLSQAFMYDLWMSDGCQLTLQVSD